MILYPAYAEKYFLYNLKKHACAGKVVDDTPRI